MQKTKFIRPARMGKQFWEEYSGELAMEYYREGKGVVEKPLIKEEKRWCATHVTGKVGQKWDGAWYTQCTIGHKRNEVCDIRTS